MRRLVTTLAFWAEETIQPATEDAEGKDLTLPMNEEQRPHAKFLAAHRGMHGFESL